jgi:hypothetical protein
VNLLFVHFKDTDSIAHDKGPYSDESMAALQFADTQIGRMLPLLDPGTMVIVYADHGGHTTFDGGHHGTLIPEDMIIPSSCTWSDLRRLTEEPATSNGMFVRTCAGSIMVRLHVDDDTLCPIMLPVSKPTPSFTPGMIVSGDPVPGIVGKPFHSPAIPPNGDDTMPVTGDLSSPAASICGRPSFGICWPSM